MTAGCGSQKGAEALALAPSSAKKGDSIFCPERGSSQTFIFRHVDLNEDDTDVEDEIRGWNWSWLEREYGTHRGTEPILHCEYVGQCEVFGEDVSHGKRRTSPVILVLH